MRVLTGVAESPDETTTGLLAAKDNNKKGGGGWGEWGAAGTATGCPILIVNTLYALFLGMWLRAVERKEGSMPSTFCFFFG